MSSENYHTTHIKVEEVAQMLGISKSLIRFWEDEFSLPKRQNGSMSRLEAAEIRLISDLIQVNSMTLEDAKAAFSQKRLGVEKLFETIAALEKIRNGLVDLKNKI